MNLKIILKSVDKSLKKRYNSGNDLFLKGFEMAQIEVKNVALGYEGKNVVEKLNFSIDRGDYLCIVGENGSGKSTLIKTLIGLKKPNEGEIITGEGFSLDEIGYLPQQTLVQKDFPTCRYSSLEQVK